MQKKVKKIILIVNFSLIAVFFIVVFLFLYFFFTEPLTSKFIKDQPVKFALTVYGTEKMLPGVLETYYVYYDRNPDVLNILSINTDMVVLKKKTKARSLKYSFFNTAEKDLKLALTNMQEDVFEITNDIFIPDYYVSVSYESLLRMFSGSEALKRLFPESSETLLERDLECLRQFELYETVLNLCKTEMFQLINSIRKKHTLLDTNISKLAFINMIIHFKMSDSEIIFFDLPAKYTKTRVEPDKDNITDI